MAYSTVQKVALASGLVLAVSLLLPKAFLSRGKRPEPPPGPEGVLTTKWLDCLMFLSRVQTVTSDQEKQLLHQLREITRVMKEGKFIDTSTPEKEAEEAPYMEDWEGYPEETYPVYDLSDGITHRQETILVDYPDPKEPSAEEIAERIGAMEEEGSEHLNWDHLPTDSGAQKDNSVTLCDPNPESCSCCFHEEEDPAVLAENAGFSADGYSEQEEATKEDWPQDFTNEGLGVSTDNTHMGGLLRKRTPQSLE
ncbi:Protein RIC-3 [Cricetulus griseus]|uniref:Protein RIC-3 n=1 Tax=Cricetulus griseus TaxID=10029 RepID=G3I636_CRIGR|nr:Protein RIC-3 [Cricetulus griseus]